MSSPTESVTTRVVHEAQYSLVEICGSLCDDGTVKVRKVLMDEVLRQPAHLVIDCKLVDYISSSGIGMLVSVLKKAHSHKTSLALCALNDELKELFALTRLDQVFPIAASLNAWQKTLA